MVVARQQEDVETRCAPAKEITDYELLRRDRRVGWNGSGPAMAA
jgi:hypothetical protein